MTFERLGLANLLKKMPAVIQHLYLLFIIVIGWVFFRAHDLPYAFKYIKSMIGLTNGKNYYPFIYLENYRIVILILGILLSTPIIKTIIGKLKKESTPLFYVIKPLYNGLSFVLIFSVLIYNIMELAQSSYNPFIYFRF